MERLFQITEGQLRDMLRDIILESIACMGANYYSVAELAHDVKAGDQDAIDRAAVYMSRYVPKGSILIPIPQHSGKSEYTLSLAKRIGQISKAKVFDILTGKPRESSLYLNKKRGEDVTKMDLGFVAEYNSDMEEDMKNARNVILIDNVVDSGSTYTQARRAIKKAYGVDVWLLTLGAVSKPKNNKLDVIRSSYPIYGMLEENEEE